MSECTRKLISIVIPCYNEGENIEAAYEAVTRVFTTRLQHFHFEILYLDNHSTDNSFLLMARLADRDKRVRAVQYARNFGFNRSLLTGYRLARGDAAIQYDCDLQDPPEAFELLVDKWVQGHDVVAGLRRKRQEHWLLRRSRSLFYRILAYISDDNLLADAGDFRLVDRSILNNLRHVNDVDPYLRGLTSFFARNQTSVAYDRRPRRAGASKFPFFKLVRFAVNAFVAHSTLPLRLASLFGIGLAVITALVAVAYAVAQILFGANWPAGFTTLAILLLGSISINSIFLGIIGEYVGRIHEQMKVRPPTLILRSVNVEQEQIENAMQLSGSSGSGQWDTGSAGETIDCTIVSNDKA